MDLILGFTQMKKFSLDLPNSLQCLVFPCKHNEVTAITFVFIICCGITSNFISARHILIEIDQNVYYISLQFKFLLRHNSMKTDSRNLIFCQLIQADQKHLTAH